MFELLLNITLSLILTVNSGIQNEFEEYVNNSFSQYDSVSYSIQENLNSFKKIKINTSRKSSIIGDKFFVPITYVDKYGLQKEKFLTVDIKLFQEVNVVQTPIEKGSVIDRNNVNKELRDLTRLNSTPLIDDNSFGKIIAKHDLQPGTILCNEYVTNKPVLENGDQINLIYQIGSVAVSMIGTVRQAGAIGDVIKIKSDNRQYSAKIINKNEALIVE